ncbi:hypothetical protein A3C87_03380 [Candidatus Kaiserbacteria bacterium RIFCSPHIGHO2_02_FULL_49_34]|uniref:Transport permease protein n=1 Tax=Candidatus Kaiserbacteria bacterium RIFCSPHIGHO2_02_FULL_49_34 TaxID=1798491 RepID=A0A1F6DIF4_9BACT|nr:MAG: hypothetical protein A3C87_03380 [Candidatus Kaiserbacteria bacterium RIFCSPHIGHO2_02_FULL_49_34]
MNTIGILTFLRREMKRIWRVKVQTFAAPLIAATLFIFIFGYVLGRSIDMVAGVSYLAFVFPGILTMYMISAAFESSSNSLYFARWTRAIHELLVAPFSYVEMVGSYVTAATLRSLLIGVGALAIGTAFGAVTITHPFLFLLTGIGIAVVFSLAGLIVGLWAQGFEQLGVFSTFVLTPLTYLGGMFYSLDLLSGTVRQITLANPLFHIIDLMRYVTLGTAQVDPRIGGLILLGTATALAILVVTLFQKGWRIRE